ncbi:MAG: DUF188 domain-containing protein, partial [Pseudomonadota bacterium]
NEADDPMQRETLTDPPWRTRGRRRGETLTAANIGNRLATRDLMKDIRAADPFHRGGGPSFAKADRSRFLAALDRLLR